MMQADALFAHDLFGKPVPTFPDHALSGRRVAAAEAVDMADGVSDRGVRIGKGDAEFQRIEQFAVDHDRRGVGALDAGMPEVASGLEGFDVKTVVMARHWESP